MHGGWRGGINVREEIRNSLLPFKLSSAACAVDADTNIARWW